MNRAVRDAAQAGARQASRCLCLLFPVLAACNDDTKRVWESEHFCYHSHVDDTSVCEGVLETLEEHFARNQEFLGFEWPAGKRIDYYKVRSQSGLPGDCPSVHGCTYGTRVYSTRPFHAHELTHSYLDTGEDRPPFLNEGVATALNCGTDVWLASASATWQEQFGGDNHRQAAWFVGHVLNHYPVEDFLEWYRSVESGDDPEVIAEEFEQAFGVSADEMWTEVQDTTEAQGMRIQCVYLMECSAPPAKMDGATIDLGACDGFNDYRTVEIEEPTDVLYYRDSWDAYGNIIRCDRARRISAQQWIDHDAKLARLEPGRHFFERSFSIDAPGRVRIFGDPELPLLSSDCSDAEPLPMDQIGMESGEQRLLIELSPGNENETFHVRMLPGTGRAIHVSTEVAAYDLLACDTCDLSCGPIDENEPMPIDEDGVATLRVVRNTDWQQAARIEVEWRER